MKATEFERPDIESREAHRIGFEEHPMNSAKKKSRLDLDGSGAMFTIVAWGGLLLSVLSQAY